VVEALGVAVARVATEAAWVAADEAEDAVAAVVAAVAARAVAVWAARAECRADWVVGPVEVEYWVVAADLVVG
jgi:hypothetical protein